MSIENARLKNMNAQLQSIRQIFDDTPEKFVVEKRRSSMLKAQSHFDATTDSINGACHVCTHDLALCFRIGWSERPILAVSVTI
jgi:hypothetical protein